MFILDASVNSALAGAGGIDSYKSQIQIAESEKRGLEAEEGKDPGSDERIISTGDGKTEKVQVARPKVDNSGEIAQKESEIVALQAEIEKLENQKEQMRVQIIKTTTTSPDAGQ